MYGLLSRETRTGGLSYADTHTASHHFGWRVRTITGSVTYRPGSGGDDKGGEHWRESEQLRLIGASALSWIARLTGARLRMYATIAHTFRRLIWLRFKFDLVLVGPPCTFSMRLGGARRFSLDRCRFDLPGMPEKPPRTYANIESVLRKQPRPSAIRSRSRFRIPITPAMRSGSS